MPPTTAQAYVADPSNYPAKMTRLDAARILKAVFIERDAPRCVTPDTKVCQYRPPEGSDACGCAFAVLVPPHLRGKLAEGELATHIAKTPSFDYFNQEIAEYFSDISRDEISAIQLRHDCATGGTLKSRMSMCIAELREAAASEGATT